MNEQPDRTQVMPGGTTVQPLPPPQSKPRSRTVMIAVISVLAVLAVLIAGDRVANAVAQNTIASALQSELSTASKPEVRLGGFPFVTQALGGSFSSAHVTADDATVSSGDTTVTIAHLDATLTSITATDRYQNVVAARGEASALLDWSSVSSLVGQQMSYEADDRMRLNFNVPIGQLNIEGHITGRLQLDAERQTITVADPQVTVANIDVPQSVVEAVSRIVLRPYTLGDLPYDIELTGLTAQPDGVLLSGTGQNIPLRGQ
ncbi:LmeA family phospholipid-binding protein [Microlunatus phosphovorus]|nr:DUF2993 domain-containing protein [Microlunatus phosphovorus]